MAVNSRRLSSIEGARARRLALPRYLRLDGARYLLGLVILLCLMSLIVLVQTGVVATRGYAISTLETQKVNLLRERTRLQERQARAQSLERIRRRAEQIGMTPVQEQQIRYIELPAAVERTTVTPDTGSD
ncbi:MAG: hypothetical protein N2378_01775 [Chloroflexaceae bacterium]|nr:hypothetical protein [Chloroflexaceae bacterium]